MKKEENGKKSETLGRLLILRKISKSILVLYFIGYEIIPVGILTLHNKITLIQKSVSVIALIKLLLLEF